MSGARAVHGQVRFDGSRRAAGHGDANLDALASNFGVTTGELWNQGDFNYDGMTNTADFTALASNFNQRALPSSALGTLVPEPSICFLCMALCSTKRRA